MSKKKKDNQPEPFMDVCVYCDQLKECPWLAMWGRKEYAICSDCTDQARKDKFNFHLRKE